MVRDCITKTESFAFNLPSKTQGAVKDTNVNFEKLIETVKDVMIPENNSSDLKSCESDLLINNESFVQVMDYLVNSKEKSSDDTQELDVDYSEIIGYANQIIELIQEKFSLTDDQINKILEENGLNKVDLLTNSGVTEVLTKLSPQQDILNLLTDSDFTKTVKQIFNLVGDAKEFLSTKYNLDSESVEKLLQNVEDLHKQTEFNNYSQVIEECVEPVRAVANSSVNLTVTDKMQTEGSNDLKVSLETQNESLVKEISNESSNESSLDQTFSSDDMSKDNNLAQLFTDKLSQTLAEKSEFVDVSKIIKQIVDEVKVTINQDMNKMEMQLYPEHLGKIGLEIVAKEGTVTAHIVASNLAVKEAIESNIPLLRSNLENQGLKVEAIEVTIASHEFEQNSNGNGDREDQNTNKKRPINFWDLKTDLDSNEEILEEQRMQIDGHSVSFKA